MALGVLSLTWAEFWTPATRQLRVVILEPAAFYFLLRLMRLERRDLLWLADTLLFTGGAIAVVGLYLYFTGKAVVEAENGARRLDQRLRLAQRGRAVPGPLPAVCAGLCAALRPADRGAGCMARPAAV